MRNPKDRNTMAAYLAVFLVCFSILALNPLDGFTQNKHVDPGSHTLAIIVDGLERTYIVHVPATYRPKTPSPLVIMLHGGGGTARAAMWETGWAEKADKEGFLVVFPNAMARDPSRQSSFSSNPQLWNDGSDRFYSGQKAQDDVGFISALIDDLAAKFALDRRRVFLTGFSNGASMCFSIGARLSDRIAAIAPVAGALWFDPPELRHPVSLCYITGTVDPLNLIEGGEPKLATGASDSVRSKSKPPVRESIQKWAKALGCEMTPKSVSDFNGVRTETYASCSNRAEVVYITVEGLGHTWAGGRSILPQSMVGPVSDRINATDVIWDFFNRHPGSVKDDEAAPQVAP